MEILLVPINVAPYQMEELRPTETFPRMVAFGAIKSAASRSGCDPAYDRFLKLGTSLSYEAFSP